MLRANIITYPDILHGGPLILDIPFHTALYLGDGVVFQKENSTNSTFSLATMEKTITGHKKGFLESNEGHLQVEYYSKKRVS